MRGLKLLSVLARSPREFTERILTFAESRVSNPTGASGEALMRDEPYILSRCGRLDRFASETPLQEMCAHVLARSGSVPVLPSGVSHNASFPLASFCYLWTRAHRPELVIETGVNNGVTTAFILQAMAVNGTGELWSIDLPPLGAESIGCLVPESLRSRWRLHTGRSRRLLPELLSRVSSIDMFLHDSLHTSRNMLFEYSTAWPKIRSGGLLASDDVTFFNDAFEKFVNRDDVSFSAIHQGKFGIAIKA